MPRQARLDVGYFAARFVRGIEKEKIVAEMKY
jgi:hypothetical protein